MAQRNNARQGAQQIAAWIEQLERQADAHEDAGNATLAASMRDRAAALRASSGQRARACRSCGLPRAA